MKKSLIKFFILLVLFNFSYSIGNTKVIYAFVNGLVCDFCARSLEKTFEKEESVKSITIDLQEKLITIVLKKEKGVTFVTPFFYIAIKKIVIINTKYITGLRSVLCVSIYLLLLINVKC